MAHIEPTLTTGSDLLLSVGGGSNFVLHLGHVYGCDTGMLACVDLKDGERKLQGGATAPSQRILLPN